MADSTKEQLSDRVLENVKPSNLAFFDGKWWGRTDLTLRDRAEKRMPLWRHAERPNG